MINQRKFTFIQFSVARKVTVSRFNLVFLALSVCVVCSYKPGQFNDYHIKRSADQYHVIISRAQLTADQAAGFRLDRGLMSG